MKDILDGNYSEKTLNVTLDATYERLTRDVLPSAESKPIAIILGGQSGAGKTTLQQIFLQSLRNNLVIINGDEFRALHPNFEELQKAYGKDSVKYTGKFSAAITEGLISRLKAEHYNIMVEGTLRTSEVPLKTCNDFKQEGYHVTLAIMAVKPEISYLSTIARYEKMLKNGDTPRATPKEHHDGIVKSLPSNLKALYDSKAFDNIVIYNRQKECLYDMTIECSKKPYEIMDNVLNGSWSAAELEEYKAICDIIIQLKRGRCAPDLQQFLNDYCNQRIFDTFKAKIPNSRELTNGSKSANTALGKIFERNRQKVTSQPSIGSSVPTKRRDNNIDI